RPEPHRRATLHRHVADEHGRGGDERIEGDLRRLSAVAVERHVGNNSAMKTRDLRVTGYRPLVPPAIILEELALSESGSRAVARWRDELSRILDLEDGRLMANVEPCSIHHPRAAHDYALRQRAVGYHPKW